MARRLLARVHGLPPGAAAVRIGGACFPRSGRDARSLLQASLAALQQAAETATGDVWFE